MLATVLAHLRQQWMGALALFLVIAGGSAYAANTIGSSDVIDNSLLSVDLKNSQVRSADVQNDGLQGGDINESSLGQVPDSDQLSGLDSTAFGDVQSARIIGLPTTTAGSFDGFGAITGVSDYQDSDASSVTTLSPNQDMWARDFAVELTTAPGDLNVIEVRLYSPGTGTSLPGCQVIDFSTSCAAAGSAVIPAGSPLTISIHGQSAVLPIPPMIDVMVGFRMTPD